MKNMLSALAMVALGLVAATGAHAQVVASVINLSGVLTVRQANGSTKLLAVKSQVEQGDTLITETNTFARLKFTDASEVVLRPASEVRVDKFSFDENKPDNDSLVINMLKGGMRTVSGLIGKRNRDVVKYVTPTATIGIRGTTIDLQNIPSAQDAVPTSGASTDAQTAALQPGDYILVVLGKIEVSNPAGSATFTEGQYGFVATKGTAPVTLPANPGLKFTLPAAYTSAASSTGSAMEKNSAGADCTIR